MMPDLATIKIGEPAHSALQGTGIETLEQLALFSEKELLALHGFGSKALGILKETLASLGLSYKR